MEEICDRAARKYTANKFGHGRNRGGQVRPPSPVRVDFMSAYAEHLRNIIKERVAHPDHYETPLKGFKVSCASYISQFSSIVRTMLLIEKPNLTIIVNT